MALCRRDSIYIHRSPKRRAKVAETGLKVNRTWFQDSKGGCRAKKAPSVDANGKINR